MFLNNLVIRYYFLAIYLLYQLYYIIECAKYEPVFVNESVTLITSRIITHYTINLEKLTGISHIQRVINIVIKKPQILSQKRYLNTCHKVALVTSTDSHTISLIYKITSNKVQKCVNYSSLDLRTWTSDFNNFI